MSAKAFNIWKGFMTWTEKQASSYSYYTLCCNLLDLSWLRFMIHIVCSHISSFYYEAKMLSFFFLKLKQTSHIYTLLTFCEGNQPAPFTKMDVSIF